MAYDAGFKQRMFDALLALSRDEQRMVKQADIQRRLEEEEGLTVTGPAVHRWFKGRIPNVETIEILARVLRCDPRWLAFGPKPEDGPVSPPQAEAVAPRPKRKRKRG